MGLIEKIIYTTAGLAILGGVIAWGTTAYKSTMSEVNKIDEQARRKIEVLAEDDIVRYDGEKISASQAITTIKMIYDDVPKIVVTVNRTEGPFTFDVERSQFSEFNKSTQEHFIPNGYYLYSVERDEDYRITQITITNVN